MLTLPECDSTSILMLARVFRKYNPLLDLSASRHIAHMVVLGQYNKPFRKPKLLKEFHDAIEILKAQPVVSLPTKVRLFSRSSDKAEGGESQRLHLHVVGANQD